MPFLFCIFMKDEGKRSTATMNILKRTFHEIFLNDNVKKEMRNQRPGIKKKKRKGKSVKVKN